MWCPLALSLSLSQWSCDLGDWMVTGGFQCDSPAVAAGVPLLVAFPARCYYPNGNRIPDKGNDWLLLGLEPSYLGAGPVSKQFATLSLHSVHALTTCLWHGNWSTQVSGSTAHTDSLTWRTMSGPERCLNCLLLQQLVTCDLWNVFTFSQKSQPFGS